MFQLVFFRCQLVEKRCNLSMNKQFIGQQDESTPKYPKLCELIIETDNSWMFINKPTASWN